MAKWLILCDANITGTGGHYLEYAKMVLAAGEARGYRAGLIVSKAFDGELPGHWRVIPAFDYTFWGRRPPPVRLPVEGLTLEDRRWLRLKYSRYGLLWAAAGRLRETVDFAGDYPPGEPAVERLRGLVLLRAWESGGSDYGINNSLLLQGETPQDLWHPEQRSAAIRRRRASLKAASRRAAKLDPDERRAMVRLLAGARATDGGRDLDTLSLRAAQADSFYRGLASALADLAPGQGSHILYPTISLAEMRGLWRLLAEEAADVSPCHHVVLRREAYRGYEEGFDARELEVHALRTALAQFRSLPPARQVCCYTDTEVLTRQYHRLGATSFVTVPVPVDMTGRGAWRPDRWQRTGRILLVLEARSVEAARAAADALAAPGAVLGAAIDLYLVVPHDQPLIDFLSAVPPGPQLFGVLSLGHPEALDAVAVEHYELIAVNSASPAFAHLWDDALEAGIPVMTGPAAWRYAALHARASAYHDAALAGAETLASETLTPDRWARYAFSSGRTESAGSAERLLVSRGSARVVRLAVPPAATLLRLTFAADGPVHLAVRFRDSADLEIAHSRHDIPVPAGPAQRSLVVAPPPSAASAVVTLANYARPDDVAISQFAVVWLGRDRPVAMIPGGSAFADLAGDLTNSVVEPLRRACAAVEATAASIRDAGLDPALLARGTIDGSRPLVAAFLGDARTEKGYQHLPGVLQRLVGRGLGPKVRLKAQAYYTSEYPEPECLRASALLAAQPRVWATPIPRALASARYAREVLRSDIVLVPYDRERYIARSSGIFVEALAAGIPCIVPAGTWMSAVLDSVAYDYHERMISAAPHAAAWLREPEAPVFHQWFGDDSPRPVGEVGVAAELPVQPARDTAIDIAVGPDENYLWLTFMGDPQRPSAFTRFDFAFRDAHPDGAEIDVRQRVLGGGLASRYSLLEKIPPGTQSVRIGCRPAFASEAYAARDVRLAAVTAPERRIVPLPGGIAFPPPAAGEDPTAIANAIEQLVEDYPTYRESAEKLRDAWAAFHSPATLIDLIETTAQMPMSADRDRFVGTDWLDTGSARGGFRR